MTEDKLTVEIHNVRPIELTDLANSFYALGAQFSKFAANNPDVRYPHEGKLFIKEVRKGSVVAELIAFSPVVVAAAVQANALLDFGQHLNNLFRYFQGEKKTGLEVDRQDCDHISDIVGLSAKDEGSNIIFNIHGDNAKINFGLDSKQAFRVKQGATLEKSKLEQPLNAQRERVVLYWYQARNAIKNKAGDKGIIEEISRKPVKIIFQDDALKTKILESSENIFQWAYVVTVSVATVEGEPVAYKVLALHDQFKIQESEGD